ncbi:MAG: Asp-tRNA(Asn)/Glu-tRNA(Gln) amidotransferase subunit GatC [Rickettsiales bacterium]|jgi:aspartyl-tRNA(Asn)/glutamyl-tRNA(Gln) amidotransferase subunit C|nr:Asp-tRNA(Asn)/Glu-tRNA(Gln) amidotransferase subunit GatC [Rickettsiales bacterium]
MSFTIEQLRKFAHSIRIEMSDSELTDMNIDQVYKWMEQMRRIDTTGVLPMFSPADGESMRDDIVTDGNIRDAVLANAPDKTGMARGYFAVPKIMDE